MSRKTALVGGVLAALVTGGLTVGVASAAADRDCPSFEYQEDAQEYFESIGGSSEFNADRLDRNGDGIACEDRPSRGGGTTTPPEETTTTTPPADDNDGAANESDNGEPAPTDDDDSTADADGSQVEVVPEGSADTGGV